MPNPLADEARQLDDAALRDAVNEAYRELFNLQFQKGTRQLQDMTTIKRARRRIARLRTILRQRELAVVAGAPIAPLSTAAPAAISPQRQRALDAREAAQAAQAAAEAAAAPEIPLPASDIAEGVATDAVATVDLASSEAPPSDADASTDTDPDTDPSAASDDGDTANADKETD
jgi:large subunit ribosomal protein L29